MGGSEGNGRVLYCFAMSSSMAYVEGLDDRFLLEVDVDTNGFGGTSPQSFIQRWS